MGITSGPVAEVAEAGVIADVLALREKVVPIDAALAQTPHERNLVATAKSIDLFPPELIQGYDGRIVMATENQIVLHQSSPLALLPVENKEEQHFQKAILCLTIKNFIFFIPGC